MKVEYLPVNEPLSPEYKVFTFDVPSDLTFSGEKVPVEDPEVMERFDREIHINAYWHSSSIFIFKRANRWLPQISEILKREGVPDDFKYLAIIESGLLNVTSPKAAVGFWQFLRPTAKEYGLVVNNEVDERYHPLKTTEAACRYLKESYRIFGNWTDAAASYNMGVAGLKRRMSEQKVDSYYDLLLNEETARYVFRILAWKEIMEQPETYGFEIPIEHLYEQAPLREIEVTSSINDLVSYSKELGINYKTLKLYNPWLRRKTLTVKGKNKKYTLLIPENPIKTSSKETQPESNTNP